MHTKKFNVGNHVVESLRSGIEKAFTELTLWLSETRIEQRPVIPKIQGTPARPMQRGNNDEVEQEEEEPQPDTITLMAVTINIPSEEDKMHFSIKYEIYVKEKIIQR